MPETPSTEETLTPAEIGKKFAEIEQMPGGFYKDKATPLMRLAKAADQLGNTERAEQLRTEAAAFLLTPRGQGFSGYFQPAFVYADDSTSPPRDYFTPDRLAWLAKRAQETSGTAHAAHLADVCWDLAPKKDPAMARLAISKYRECADGYWRAGKGLEFGDAIKRAVQLAAILGDASQLSEITADIVARFDELDGRKEYRYCLDLADALEKATKAPPAEDAQKRVLEVLDHGASYYRETHPKKEDSFGPVHGPNEHFSRSFAERSLALAKAWKRKDVTAEATKLAQAQSYEREAERAANELARLVFLQDAEKLYGELGRTADQDRLRVAMGQAGKRAESEFKEARGEVQIPHAEIKAYIEPLIGGSLAGSLENLSAAPHFIPSLDSSKKSAAEGKRQFPLQAIMPKLILKDGHIVGGGATDEELLDLAVTRDFVLGIKIGGVFRSHLIERLIKEQGLSTDGLLAHFRKWGHCKDKHIEFLGIGFAHYFKGDHISAIHVLVPQFEDILRGFLERAGQPISDPQRGKFFILDSLLKNPTLVKVAGEDLITWYRLSLSDPSGINLRNDVAHGLSSPESMTKETAELVIHLLLSFTRFKFEDNKAE